VFSARNGREALDMADAHKGEIDLLVSDVTMPGMDGQELAAKLTAREPKIKVILLSGYSRVQIALQRGWKFIQKPFRPQQLKDAVEDTLK
jgi:two-component system cell cycle sensor histidine kinase/response regulator CckA